MIMAIRNTKHEILKALVEILEGDDLGTITTKTIAQKTDVTESAPVSYTHLTLPTKRIV